MCFWIGFRFAWSHHRHLINRPSTPLKTLAQQLLLYGGCQWVQIIALNLNFPLKFIRVISSCWIKHEKESKKIRRARSIYSWSRGRIGTWLPCDCRHRVKIAQNRAALASYTIGSQFEWSHWRIEKTKNDTLVYLTCTYKILWFWFIWVATPQCTCNRCYKTLFWRKYRQYRFPFKVKQQK